MIKGLQNVQPLLTKTVEQRNPWSARRKGLVWRRPCASLQEAAELGFTNALRRLSLSAGVLVQAGKVTLTNELAWQKKPPPLVN